MRYKLAVRWTLVGAYALAICCLGALTDPPGARGQGAARENPGLISPQAGPPKATAITPEARADIFMARKDYPAAVDYYTRALKQKNNADAALWNKLGIAYQVQQNYSGARKAYNRAIRRRKDYAEPWNNMGTTYYLEDKFAKAVRCYQHALKLQPGSATFHLNLGTGFYRLKKVQEAVSEYRMALTLDPTCLTQHSPTGTTLQTRGADVEFYFYLAKVFASLGRTEDSIRYLHRAFEDGFKDQKRLDEDPDFQKISQDPAYLELIKNPPVSIKD
jgi:tetratricopeptide (TPR) repeat protein